MLSTQTTMAVNRLSGHFHSQRLILKGKNEPFRLENISNLTQGFVCMTILTRKFCQNYHIKTHGSNLMHFQGEIINFFLKNDTLRMKVLIVPLFDDESVVASLVIFTPLHPILIFLIRKH